jgi:ribosomal 50S subunit-recycling heat shock protein
LFDIKGLICIRLDKFLKVSRIIKRRTVASEACGAGRVSLNGKPAKASHDVKPGDIIEIRFASGVTKAEILAVKETAGKDGAGDLFRIIT